MLKLSNAQVTAAVLSEVQESTVRAVFAIITSRSGTSKVPCLRPLPVQHGCVAHAGCLAADGLVSVQEVCEVLTLLDMSCDKLQVTKMLCDSQEMQNGKLSADSAVKVLSSQLCLFASC